MKRCPFTGEPKSTWLYDDTTPEMVTRFNLQNALYAALATVVVTPKQVIELFVRASNRKKRT